MRARVRGQNGRKKCESGGRNKSRSGVEGRDRRWERIKGLWQKAGAAETTGWERPKEMKKDRGIKGV